jgi:hypothetical protein
VRDALNSFPFTLDHPNDITFFTYLGHGGVNFIGWGTGRPPPLGVQNVRASELRPFRLGNLNTNGVVNYAVIFGCRSVSPVAGMMSALIGTSSGRSYNYYGRLGLRPKLGFGCPKGQRVFRLLLNEPYTPPFTFFSKWLEQTYIERDGNGWPLYTFAQAFTRARDTSSEHAEGAQNFALVGCTNCYLEEVITGRLRTPTPAYGEPSGSPPAGGTSGYIQLSPPGQTVWQGFDER